MERVVLPRGASPSARRNQRTSVVPRRCSTSSITGHRRSRWLPRRRRRRGRSDPAGGAALGRFQRRKILLVSTLKTRSLSRREYEPSDQRRYFVPCPHCDEHQTLELENLRWPDSRPRETKYACAHNSLRTMPASYSGPVSDGNGLMRSSSPGCSPLHGRI
jgi:hypothetical protein